MRLLAYEYEGEATIAVVLADGVAPVMALERFWSDVEAGIAVARTIEQPAVALEGIRQIVPLPRDARVLCAGLNYAAHAQEADFEVPEQPDLFARWRSTLTVDGAEVPVPPREPQLDWEGELAVVIGRELRDVTPEQAHEGILAYACFNDLSARRFQMASPRWSVGKNADRSGPLGPWLVTTDEIADPGALRIRTSVNGETVQDGSTSKLIFSPVQIIAYASGAMTLRAGDVVATGTPEGVGFTRKPPRFLHPGDVVEVEVQGIGKLTNPIVERKPASWARSGG